VVQTAFRNDFRCLWSQLDLDLMRAANAERQSFLRRMMQKMQELRLAQDMIQRAASEVPKNYHRNSSVATALLALEFKQMLKLKYYLVHVGDES
jgi:hypothetical protein